MNLRYQGLSHLRLIIFARLFPLLTLLVIAICIASLVFALYHHRQDMKYLFLRVAHIHAEELVGLIHKKNNKEIKKRLKLLCSNKLIAYVFIDKKGKIIIKVPSDNFPLSSQSIFYKENKGI